MTSIIKNQISEPEVSQNWVNKNIAAQILGISIHTLKLYRKRYWTLGIHFQYLNSRTIRYHEGLIRDWFANICAPQAHQWAIQVYLASLLSNQSWTKSLGSLLSELSRTKNSCSTKLNIRSV